jgi:hypothetical protein
MEKEIIDLGNLPLVNNLCATQQESINAKRFTLRVIEKDNLLMKLDTEIPSEEMFEEYLYRSSINIPYIKHCEIMWEYAKQFNPQNIADIGGNDGALLKAFQSKSDKKLNLSNIDASKSFKEDNEKNGINYYNNYWGDITFKNKFDLITSTNVFQHNPFYEKFLNGIQKNLNGRWVLEFPYFLDTVKTNQFDQIYHEHVFYWLLTPLYPLFKKYGLKIIDISRQEIHGGSLRIVSSNIQTDVENINLINSFLKEEEDFDFKNWQSLIKEKIIQDRLFIKKLIGKTSCFGAAAKGCIYLNALELNNNNIDFIIDDTVQKQNKFSPGTGIKICSRKIIKTKDCPDNIIILAHNFKDYIADSLRKYGYTGKLFAMIPEITEI